MNKIICKYYNTQTKHIVHENGPISLISIYLEIRHLKSFMCNEGTHESRKIIFIKYY